MELELLMKEERRILKRVEYDHLMILAYLLTNVACKYKMMCLDDGSSVWSKRQCATGAANQINEPLLTSDWLLCVQRKAFLAELKG